MTNLRIAALATHPIQYYSPWFAHLAGHCDLEVFYAHRQTAEGQASAGFSTAFEWDLPLLDGYHSRFLTNIARRPGLSSFLGCNTPEIGPIVQNGKFDALVMFGWNKRSFLQAWRGALRARIPVLIRLDSQLGASNSWLRRAIKAPLYRIALPCAAHYLSPGIRSDEYLTHYNVPAHRIHRVPHMVDVARFRASAHAARRDGHAAARRAAHGADANTTVFLFVGKLIEKKRPLLLLEALARLGPNVPAQLWIVGDGPLEGEVAARVSESALPVHRLGFVNQSEIPSVYAAADCLVLPSTAQETWGLVVNEAQACGLPAIVSEEAGSAPELIIDDVTGWTLREGNADRLATILRHAMLVSCSLKPEPIYQMANACSFVEGTRRLLATAAHLVSSRPVNRTKQR